MKALHCLILAVFCTTSSNVIHTMHVALLQQSHERSEKTINHALDKKLLQATVKGNLNMVKVLLSGDTVADIDAKDEHGNTPLIEAARRGYTTIAQELIDAGADLNAQTNYGNTALTWAAYKRHKAIIKALMAAGADIDGQDAAGNTILMKDARNGYKANVAALIAAGADQTLINKENLTAGDVAKNKEMYDKAVAEGFAPYFARQVDSKKIIVEETLILKDLANIIAEYAYGSSSALHLPEDDQKENAKGECIIS